MNPSPDRPALHGVRVLSTAINVPGPVAAARLGALGAAVVKLEPPAGDPLAVAARSWYDELHAGVDVRRLDLKTAAGQAELAGQLERTDVLLTASRPAALARLGLDEATLRVRHPCLVGVAIVGGAGERAERAGHDLTYVAEAGLLEGPHPARTLLADLSGAAAVVEAVLLGLLTRSRTGQGSWRTVSLVTAVAELAAPHRHGLTAPGGPLGGGLPLYDVYRSADGWVAVAALEDHFARALLTALELPEASRAALERVFATRTSAAWTAWADALDLPVTGVA